MKFRKSVKTDIYDILKIIKQAQDYFKENGINQWQNNYPNIETITCDIENENSYVLLKDDTVIATTAVIFDGEETYESIYDGRWLTSDRYATIHRIAVDNSYKGLGISSEIIRYIEKICRDKNIFSIKIDTHEENESMKNLLKKNNFEYCGVIYLNDGSKRIAFEKLL